MVRSQRDGDESVKPQGDARTFGHAVRERGQEMLVERRLNLAAGTAQALIMQEAGALLFGRGQFVKPIGQLHAVQIKLETRGHPRIHGRAASA